MLFFSAVDKYDHLYKRCFLVDYGKHSFNQFEFERRKKLLPNTITKMKQGKRPTKEDMAYEIGCFEVYHPRPYILGYHKAGRHC